MKGCTQVSHGRTIGTLDPWVKQPTGGKMIPRLNRTNGPVDVSRVTPRRVLFFSSTRADFWPQEPVLRAAVADARIDPLLLVTGTHLDVVRGGTADEIALDGLAVERRPVRNAGDGPVAMARMSADVLEETELLLGEHRPHLMVLLGDRHELLAAALAATIARVPIVHLHGGEHTAGAIDDAIRHAVSKLAHLHCCSAQPYADRLVAMGEEPWRIHVTGAPSLDRLVAAAQGATLARLEAVLGCRLPGPVGLLTYHPPSLHPERMSTELDALLGACDALASVVVTYPGMDAGAAEVLARLERWASERTGVVLVPSLGAAYPMALATVDVVVGNSSSGIVEAPSFSVPVINVGDRQAGRIRAGCVIDAPGEPAALRRAMATALSPSFRCGPARSGNPHGDARSARRIVEVLAAAPLDELLEKKAP